MKDNEYLAKLFDDYIITLNALNEASPSFYSRDEYKLRHKIFKKINSEYNRYKLKLLMMKIKLKITLFKQNITDKRKNKIINQYNKLKNSGEFLPKKIDE